MEQQVIQLLVHFQLVFNYAPIELYPTKDANQAFDGLKAVRDQVFPGRAEFIGDKIHIALVDYDWEHDFRVFSQNLQRNSAESPW